MHGCTCTCVCLHTSKARYVYLRQNRQNSQFSSSLLRVCLTLTSVVLLLCPNMVLLIDMQSRLVHVTQLIPKLQKKKCKKYFFNMMMWVIGYAIYSQMSITLFYVHVHIAVVCVCKYNVCLIVSRNRNNNDIHCLLLILLFFKLILLIY